MNVEIINGDCLEILKQLPEKSVNCCVTSPPYWGLRDYGLPPIEWPDGWVGCLGLEPTPEMYVSHICMVFKEVRRVLKDDGTLWLNIGDTYAASRSYQVADSKHTDVGNKMGQSVPEGMKQKDLVGIPWLVAFALRADGWYLRQDIIWSKPNPMPESVTDRCTKSHEYVFLLSKSKNYFYDHESIKEPAAPSSISRLNQDVDSQKGSDRVPGKTNGSMKAVGGKRSKRDTFKRENSKRERAIHGQSVGTHRPSREESEYDIETRNKRSVWTVSTMPYKEAHFATFPIKLIEPCILAGCPEGGTVLDPFGGSGTTGEAAVKHRRSAILIELNPEYIEIQKKRTSLVQQMLI